MMLLLLAGAGLALEHWRITLAVLAGLLLIDISTIVRRYIIGPYRNLFARQSPRDGELTRASHGVGILVLLVIAGIALRQIWRWQLGDVISALQAGDPWHWVPAGGLLLVVTLALMWVMTGVRRSLRASAERDGRVITRSLLKIAAGAAVVLLLMRPPMQYAGASAFVWSVPYLPYAVLAVAAWLATTGMMKFALAAKGRSRPRPVPVTPKKEPARDATLAEALEDMKGRGGRKTALDDRDF
jgi:hypothetical protein